LPIRLRALICRVQRAPESGASEKRPNRRPAGDRRNAILRDFTAIWDNFPPSISLPRHAYP